MFFEFVGGIFVDEFFGDGEELVVLVALDEVLELELGDGKEVVFI